MQTFYAHSHGVRKRKVRTFSLTMAFFVRIRMLTTRNMAKTKVQHAMVNLGKKIKNLRLSFGWDQGELAEKLGKIDRSTITKWETGKQTPRPDHLMALANLAQVSPQEFLGLTTVTASGRVVEVVGEVQAGQWSEAAQWHEDDFYRVNVNLPDRWRSTKIFGLVVNGDSFNLIYPEGTVVFVAPLEQVPGGVVDGDTVVVMRANDNGEYETTLKELKVTLQGEMWLWPRSTSPEHQTPVRIETGRRGSTATATITGRVVAAVVYRD